jgi:putative ABC transport system substrate-binding protein
MRRRDFVKGIVGSAVACPLFAYAQQAAMPVVALINGGSANAPPGRLAAFRKGLSETGYVEDQNVAVEYHWLEGHYERIPALLTEIIERHVAVIATPAFTVAALAAKAATATIPIVFSVGEDPVALGPVVNLAHPGSNATGVNIFAFEIYSKRLALMHELLPKATRFAVLINPANPVSAREVTSKALKDAARTLGLDLLFFNASTREEIDAAFAAFAREKPDALFIGGDSYFAARQTQLATLAVRDRIPTSCFLRDMAQAGLLMSYGVTDEDTFGQVGVYTGRILKGAKPADLPVLQSTKFEFVINLQTAKSLGLDVPPTLLARADEVIE